MNTWSDTEEIMYRARIEQMRMREEGERMRKEIEMAIARPQQPRGIESWHKDGFEARVLQEVKQALVERDKQHKSEMNELRAEMRHAKRTVEHINGFYTWLMEVYPDTVLQYKALMDLQKIGETK